MPTGEKYIGSSRRIHSLNCRAILGANPRHRRRASRLGDSYYLAGRDIQSKAPELLRQMEKGYLEGKVISEFTNPSTHQSKFRELLNRWKHETGGLSLARQKQFHPTYLKIVGMGEKAIPYLLREIRQGRRYLFVALESIANENPAATAESFDDAVTAWIDWGRMRRLI